MNTKKYIISILLIWVFVSSAYSQRWRLTRYEVMAGVGTSYSQTDIGGYGEIWESYKGIDILGTRPSFFIGARYRLAEKISVKFNTTIGWISGRDALGGNPTRDYSFETFILEPSIRAEYSILPENVIGTRYSIMDLRGGVKNRKFSLNVYLFGGMGYAFIEPIANQKLKEDPKNRYHTNFSHHIAVVPGGLGIKYLLTPLTGIGVEFSGQYAFSDYIDAFNSKYPAKSANDIYFFANVSFVYKFKTGKNGLPILKFGRTLF